MKPLDLRTEEDQTRTLEWMYKIFTGSAVRKSPVKAKTGDPLMATDSALTAASAGERPNASDTVPPA